MLHYTFLIKSYYLQHLLLELYIHWHMLSSHSTSTEGIHDSESVYHLDDLLESDIPLGIVPYGSVQIRLKDAMIM